MTQQPEQLHEILRRAVVAERERCAKCECGHCSESVRHASDCAVHAAPALPVGACTCGAQQPDDRATPTVARCTKCNRGFVTLPKAWPAYDPYLPPDTPRRLFSVTQPCGGEIVRVDDEAEK